MDGPEAARVMREELGYGGVILGTYFQHSILFSWLSRWDNMNCYCELEGITGNVLTEDIDAFISGGANEVISKPLTKAKLLSAMDHYAASIRRVEY